MEEKAKARTFQKSQSVRHRHLAQRLRAWHPPRSSAQLRFLACNKRSELRERYCLPDHNLSRVVELLQHHAYDLTFGDLNCIPMFISRIVHKTTLRVGQSVDRTFHSRRIEVVLGHDHSYHFAVFRRE